MWVTELHSDFRGGARDKETVNAGDLRDMGSMPWLRRSPGGRAWQLIPLFLPAESPTDRGSWRATVHGATLNWTGLKRFSEHSHTHELHSVSSGPF